jgi:hypothetical protein
MALQAFNHARQIYGVDFSGAARAGKKIWITHSLVEGRKLRIEKCFQAEHLPGSGQERGRCLAALRDFVRQEQAGIFGFDFPFGLPYSLVSEKTWEDFVLSFPHAYNSPEQFRDTSRRLAGGRELKRVTDHDARTPFSPYNLRLYRQTYFGIRDLLTPLVKERQACVLPMQPARPDRAWLLEICPASTLKQEGLKQSYKGRSTHHYEARARILDAIEKATPLQVPGSLRSLILEESEGDALDSVMAAVAAFRTVRSPDGVEVDGNQPYAIEGYVYV